MDCVNCSELPGAGWKRGITGFEGRLDEHGFLRQDAIDRVNDNNFY